MTRHTYRPKLTRRFIHFFKINNDKTHCCHNRDKPSKIRVNSHIVDGPIVICSHIFSAGFQFSAIIIIRRLTLYHPSGVVSLCLVSYAYTPSSRACLCPDNLRPMFRRHAISVHINITSHTLFLPLHHRCLGPDSQLVLGYIGREHI